MNLPRSTLYADLGCEQEDAVVGEITAITETRRGYGYRRVTAGPLGPGISLQRPRIASMAAIRARRHFASKNMYHTLITHYGMIHAGHDPKHQG